MDEFAYVNDMQMRICIYTPYTGETQKLYSLLIYFSNSTLKVKLIYYIDSLHAK